MALAEITEGRKRVHGGHNPTANISVDLIKSAGATLIDTILEELPEGRARSVALTQIETGVMWAVKAVFEDRDHGG